MSSESIAIETHDLTVSYRSKAVLWAVDFKIPEGKRVAIVGPNGAGKSTLLKTLMGFLPSSSGWVRIFGEPVESKRGAIAYVPQREEVDWDFPITVRDVVLMGRDGRLKFYQRPGAADKEAANRALERVGMASFNGRQIRQLSGGQQQRVYRESSCARSKYLPYG